MCKTSSAVPLSNCFSCAPNGATILPLNDCNPLLLLQSFFCCGYGLEISLFHFCSLQKVLLWKIQTHTKEGRIIYERMRNPCTYYPASTMINPWPVLFHLFLPALSPQPCPQITLKGSLAYHHVYKYKDALNYVTIEISQS